MSKSQLKAFASTQNKGFRMTFKNGVTASVQWGPANYCEVRSFAIGSYDAPMKSPTECWDSETAEIAAWDREGKWILKEILPGEGDDVKGWVTTDEVLDFLVKCAKFKKEVTKCLLS